MTNLPGIGETGSVPGVRLPDKQLLTKLGLLQSVAGTHVPMGRMYLNVLVLHSAARSDTQRIVRIPGEVPTIRTSDKLAHEDLR